MEGRTKTLSWVWPQGLLIVWVNSVDLLIGFELWNSFLLSFTSPIRVLYFLEFWYSCNCSFEFLVVWNSEINVYEDASDFLKAPFIELLLLSSFVEMPALPKSIWWLPTERYLALAPSCLLTKWAPIRLTSFWIFYFFGAATLFSLALDLKLICSCDLRIF